ncbi:MAG: hypothetical protein RRY18_04140, partial [Clostridia bacterium]
IKTEKTNLKEEKLKPLGIKSTSPACTYSAELKDTASILSRGKRHPNARIIRIIKLTLLPTDVLFLFPIPLIIFT